MPTFSAALRVHVDRLALPVRRVALLARLPHQTLHNWLNGSHPRWHPRLPVEIQSLADALGLDQSQRDELLELAGCGPTPPPTKENFVTSYARPPKGWFAAGKSPKSYDMGVETKDDSGRPAAYLKSKTGVDAFGTLMQQFKADNFRSRKIRFSAEVRSEDIRGWAGLWMRVDDANGDSPSFDNMQGRPIRGTSDWTRHTIVLPVPEDAVRIALGLLLDGPGRVWMRSIEFGFAPHDAASTDEGQLELPDAPRNLSLAE